MADGDVVVAAVAVVGGEGLHRDQAAQDYGNKQP
jgi:hypothetical protein